MRENQYGTEILVNEMKHKRDETKMTKLIEQAIIRLNQQPPRQILEARRGDRFDPTLSLSFTRTSDPQGDAESSRRFFVSTLEVREGRMRLTPDSCLCDARSSGETHPFFPHP